MNTIQNALDQAVADGIPGIVAEVRDGDRTWFGTAGVADLETGRTRTQDEQFHTGSLTKAFTATVTFKLVDEHRLRLDDTVEQWLPGMVTGNGNDGSKITVRHLLQQTSGLVNYAYDDKDMMDRYITTGYLTHRFDRWTPEELVKIGMKYPPYYAPGTDFRYSNANYQLLGLIIERASGRTYAEELSRLVLGPLGLTGTYLAGNEVTISGPHPRMYTKLPMGEPDAKVYDVTELDSSLGWAAGGIVSTTGDLARFFGALLGGELFSPALQAEMWATVSTEGSGWIPNTRYGMGTFEQNLPNGVTVFGGGGALNGSWTYVMGTRDGRHLVVCNVNGDFVNPIAEFWKILEAEFPAA
ncbi:beta-lactamase family protein [Solihabitans fulvus]|uniref:Beta-lactamase family protein n=1 Tax=Solihabitans fulvus TaxID=1892852 RepID=A0A5B2XE45_9PSEU|nr:serine hydrolase domain-containing protein [Solihabitans fulvus]KAA2261977.1 beta-lactamase family protein [Solihabitans fulvus]